ncbi:MAG TPA: alpha-glucuronidase family glycosyl hydrolase [Armatimonadota bacterium]|nr:alpha-glucuronidase family glycosyl hydrolase [Armatimonadota bacterium]
MDLRRIACGAACAFLVATTLAAGADDARIVSDPVDDLRLEVAVERLRSAAVDASTSAYTYVIGQDAASDYVPEGDLAGLGPEGFLIRTVPHADGPRVVVTGTNYQGIAYGVFRLARIMLSAPERLADLDLRMEPAVPIREETRYLVEFEARVVSGEGNVYLDWYGGAADGRNAPLHLGGPGGWQTYRIEVSPSPLDVPAEMSLRIVALGSDQELLLDDVRMWAALPAR